MTNVYSPKYLHESVIYSSHARAKPENKTSKIAYLHQVLHVQTEETSYCTANIAGFGWNKRDRNGQSSRWLFLSGSLHFLLLLLAFWKMMKWKRVAFSRLRRSGSVVNSGERGSVWCCCQLRLTARGRRGLFFLFCFWSRVQSHVLLFLFFFLWLLCPETSKGRVIFTD